MDNIGFLQINVTDEDMSFKKTYESATAAVAISYGKD